jgi:hypothetical protein
MFVHKPVHLHRAIDVKVKDNFADKESTSCVLHTSLVTMREGENRKNIKKDSFPSTDGSSGSFKWPPSIFKRSFFMAVIFPPPPHLVRFEYEKGEKKRMSEECLLVFISSSILI